MLHQVCYAEPTDVLIADEFILETMLYLMLVGVKYTFP